MKNSKNYIVQSVGNNAAWEDETYSNLSKAIKAARENISNGANSVNVVSDIHIEGTWEYPTRLHYASHANCTGGQYCTFARSITGESI